MSSKCVIRGALYFLVTITPMARSRGQDWPWIYYIETTHDNVTIIARHRRETMYHGPHDNALTAASLIYQLKPLQPITWCAIYCNK